MELNVPEYVYAFAGGREFIMLRIVRWMLEALGIVTIIGSLVGTVTFFELATLLQYKDGPKNADFIFPLAGDQRRLIKSAQLYRLGFAPKIILSNEIGQPTKLASLKLERNDSINLPENVLAARGVPVDAVTTFGEDLASTAQEAEALRTFLNGRSATILVVASPYEGLRVKLIFARTLPNVRCLVVHSDSELLPKKWWEDKAASQMAVMEVAKIVYFVTGGIFRASKMSNAVAASEEF
jgi:uncharacterized SAM-binding protein YcdF (DUF218 family)